MKVHQHLSANTISSTLLKRGGIRGLLSRSPLAVYGCNGSPPASCLGVSSSLTVYHDCLLSETSSAVISASVQTLGLLKGQCAPLLFYWEWSVTLGYLRIRLSLFLALAIRFQDSCEVQTCSTVLTSQFVSWLVFWPGLSTACHDLLFVYHYKRPLPRPSVHLLFLSKLFRTWAYMTAH